MSSPSPDEAPHDGPTPPAGLTSASAGGSGSGHWLVAAPGLAPPSGYAHAVVAAGGGPVVFLAGQTALGADGAVVGTTIAEQFDVAAGNVVAALAAAGGRPDDLVSLTIYTTDMEAYRRALPDIGVAYRRHFGRRYPAMALIGVAELFDPEALVELVGLAVLPGDP